MLNCTGAPITFGERLGWKPTDVVLILHVDDAGMSHPSNLGAIEATEHGVATSFSIMMPCGWVLEIAHYLKSHPQADRGLHLTLTSEWRPYRWGPFAGKSAVPGLVDNEGGLWQTVEQVAAPASVDVIERENLERWLARLGRPLCQFHQRIYETSSNVRLRDRIVARSSRDRL